MPRLTKIYTRKGDDGSTGLGGGQRVAKDSPRVAAYGTVDELNSAIGVALAHGLVPRLARALPPIQNELFHLGSDLCFLEEDKGKWPIPADRAAPRRRARGADRRAERGGGPARQLHPAGRLTRRRAPARRRTICRRAERDVLTLSRLEPIGQHAMQVPEPPVRRVVRDVALREPPARRRRAALGRGGLTPPRRGHFPAARRKTPHITGGEPGWHRRAGPEHVAPPLQPGRMSCIQGLPHPPRSPRRLATGRTPRQQSSSTGVVRLRRPRRARDISFTIPTGRMTVFAGRERQRQVGACSA